MLLPRPCLASQHAFFSSAYQFDAIESDEMAAHVYAVEHALRSGMVSGISRTVDDMFIVHYMNTYACSSVTLSTLEDFVLYMDGPQHNFKEDDEKHCSINVVSFRYDNAKLLQMSPHDPVLQAVITQQKSIYKWACVCTKATDIYRH